MPEADEPAGHVEQDADEHTPAGGDMTKAEKWTPEPGASVLVPVTDLEAVVEGAKVRHYVQAPGAHTPAVTFPSYHVTTTKAGQPAAILTFLERTDAELVVGNAADGQTYRLQPELEIEPAAAA